MITIKTLINNSRIVVIVIHHIALYNFKNKEIYFFMEIIYNLLFITNNISTALFMQKHKSVVFEVISCGSKNHYRIAMPQYFMY